MIWGGGSQKRSLVNYPLYIIVFKMLMWNFTILKVNGIIVDSPFN